MNRAIEKCAKGRLQKKNVKLGLLAEVRGERGPSGFWGPNLLLGQYSIVKNGLKMLENYDIT